MKKLLLGLLLVSLFCFWFDLFHMLFHLSQAPALRQISGVPGKLLVKCALFLIPVSLCLMRQKWMRLFVLIYFVSSGAFLSEASFWGESKTACQSAREMLLDSGTAKDAKENLFGAIQLTPPEEKFPRAADKVTWWGKFQPFEFWQSPEFKSTWLNPQGQVAAARSFKGGHCALAKSGILAEGLPNGEFQPGVWKVVVTCEDYLIDQRFFEVAGPRVPQAQAPSAESGKAAASPGVTIWAKDKV